MTFLWAKRDVHPPAPPPSPNRRDSILIAPGRAGGAGPGADAGRPGVGVPHAGPRAGGLCAYSEGKVSGKRGLGGETGWVSPLCIFLLREPVFVGGFEGKPKGKPCGGVQILKSPSFVEGACFSLGFTGTPKRRPPTSKKTHPSSKSQFRLDVPK